MNPILNAAVLEIERHVAASGWDQPVRLYALVDTAALLRQEPALAFQMGLLGDVDLDLPVSLTPVEQEEFPGDSPLDEILAGIVWGPAVDGCALSLERLMLPPQAEAGLPTSEDEAAAYAAAHPERQDVRIVVGVLRDGSVDTVLRMRSQDRDDAVVFGPELVPGLARALAATFED